MVDLFLHNDGERTYIKVKRGIKLVRLDLFKWLGWIVVNWEDRSKLMDYNYDVVCRNSEDIATVEFWLKREKNEKLSGYGFTVYNTEIKMILYCNDNKIREGTIHQGYTYIGADSNFALIVVVEPLGDVSELVSRTKDLITGGALIDKIVDIMGFFTRAGRREEEVVPEMVDKKVKDYENIDVFNEGKVITGMGERDIISMFSDFLNPDFKKIGEMLSDKSIPIASATATHYLYNWIKKNMGPVVYIFALPFTPKVYCNIRDIIRNGFKNFKIPYPERYDKPVELSVVSKEFDLYIDYGFDLLRTGQLRSDVYSDVFFEYNVLSPVYKDYDCSSEVEIETNIS